MKGLFLYVMFISTIMASAQKQQFYTGAKWYDTNGNIINAHGGGLIYDHGKYYWFGEKRGQYASEGVNVYSSNDLYNWKFERLALQQDADSSSDITIGSVIERPKVIYNPRTQKYVMWFHLELKGQGYKAARAGVAVSDKITGPYRFINSFRPNGNMSRDMALFVDNDGSAYQVYSSRENYDLRIVKLSDDFISATTQDVLLFSNHREAPAIFKSKGKYYLITSGCTGWAPNKATIHTSSSVWGPWQLSAYNPMQGPGADTTFGAQSTYVLPMMGKKDAFIFLADKWNPANLTDSRYIWLPVQFNGINPYIQWMDTWNLNFFKNK